MKNVSNFHLVRVNTATKQKTPICVSPVREELENFKRIIEEKTKDSSKKYVIE